MPVPRLVLYGREPWGVPKSSLALAAGLVDLGLMGASIPGVPGAHLAGARFLDLVVFLGCSPEVALAPSCDAERRKGRYCHVRLPEWSDAPVFRLSPRPATPRCPRCRASLKDWKAQLAGDVSTGAAPLACPNCGHSAGVGHWQWRQTAGWGRWFVEIWNIFPHEAVPSDELLTRLAQLSQGESAYFYS